MRRCARDTFRLAVLHVHKRRGSVTSKCPPWQRLAVRGRRAGSSMASQRGQLRRRRGLGFVAVDLCRKSMYTCGHEHICACTDVAGVNKFRVTENSPSPCPSHSPSPAPSPSLSLSRSFPQCIYVCIYIYIYICMCVYTLCNAIIAPIVDMLSGTIWQPLPSGNPCQTATLGCPEFPNGDSGQDEAAQSCQTATLGTCPELPNGDSGQGEAAQSCQTRILGTGEMPCRNSGHR